MARPTRHNNDLLAELDAVLLEVEQRLVSYANLGAEMVETADEGLALAVKVRARLDQTNTVAYRTESELKSVGIGEWEPTGIRGFRNDPRLSEND